MRLPVILAAITLALLAIALQTATAADAWANIALRPHPGAQLPLREPLVDEQGRRVMLGDYFTGKPVVLVLEYLRCRTLCGITLQNVIGALGRTQFEPGRDFQFVAVDIDPRDDPTAALTAKARYLTDYHHSSAASGVHFLTGPTDAVKPIAEAIGFSYRYDPALDQYVHPAGLVVAMPDGRISSYILGVGVTPAQLTEALAGAAQDRTTGPLTKLLLLCHLQGAPIGRYTVPVLAAFTLADIAAGATLIAVFAAIRRRRHS